MAEESKGHDQDIVNIVLVFIFLTCLLTVFEIVCICVSMFGMMRWVGEKGVAKFSSLFAVQNLFFFA